MPELPEVETIRRQLEPALEGRRIDSVEVLDARWVAPATPHAFVDRLNRRRIERVARRGKYLVLELDDDSALVLHLRMTGNLLLLPPDHELPDNHLRGMLRLDDGSLLAFVDPRRFGTAEVLSNRRAVDDYFAARLGPEPFDAAFTGAYLHHVTRRRTTPIKALLLDQRHVAGVGNIYADEALFRAGIAPHRRAGRLTRRQCDALRDAIRDALAAGIDAKGASIDDFRDVYGTQGSFQDRFLVHRREGLPCPECGNPIVKRRIAGRGTYYCPRCQRG